MTATKHGLRGGLPFAMTALRKVVVVSIAAIAGACATVAPVKVTVDTSAPAVAASDGLRATLRVLSSDEIGQLFGGIAGSRPGAVELRVANHGVLPLVLKRKLIRFVKPTGERVSPMSPLAIAFSTRPGGGLIWTGSTVVDVVQLVLFAGRLAQNKEVSAQWEHLMPETCEVAAGGERRMVLAFPTQDWAPGLWRLELPFNAGAGAADLRLSIPLTFTATAERRGAITTGSGPLDPGSSSKDFQSLDAGMR